MSESSRSESSASTIFLALQVGLLCVALAGVSHRMQRVDSRISFPAMRTQPPAIAPTYDYPWIVSDSQLETVLTKLYPRLREERPKINHIDHALRFWGVDARFNDPKCFSGEEMRAILTDHRLFAKYWGSQAEPLLEFTDEGVKVRTREGRATSSHVDHTVAGLAEVGTPSEFPVITPDRAGTMRDLVKYVYRTFELNQTEYEWSTLTFALCLQPARSFVTHEGQRVTFDMLADRLMRQPLRQGVCYGNHRLHSLVMLLRLDAEDDLLSDAGRDRILDHLLQASQRLVETQSEEGYWTHRWPGDPQDAEATVEDEEAAKILATGHALEWLALAPEAVHPPREVLVRAGQWLTHRIVELDDAKVAEYYTFLTHAGRALALWRGRFPAEFLPPVEMAEGEGQQRASDILLEESEAERQRTGKGVNTEDEDDRVQEDDKRRPDSAAVGDEDAGPPAHDRADDAIVRAAPDEVRLKASPPSCDNELNQPLTSASAAFLDPESKRRKFL